MPRRLAAATLHLLVCCAPEPPRLADLLEETLTPSCGAYCHAEGPADLTFAPERAHAELVGVPSVGRPDVLRVAPGEPEASYLVWKIRGDDGIVGDPMPPNPPLPPERIERIVEWITAGALP